jgi:hypothetical protein
VKKNIQLAGARDKAERENGAADLLTCRLADSLPSADRPLAGKP